MKTTTSPRTEQPTTTPALEAYDGYEVRLTDDAVAGLTFEAYRTTPTPRRASRLTALRHLDGAQMALLAVVVVLAALLAFVVPAAITGFVLGFAFVVSLFVVIPYVVLSGFN